MNRSEIYRKLRLIDSLMSDVRRLLAEDEEEKPWEEDEGTPEPTEEDKTPDEGPVDIWEYWESLEEDAPRPEVGTPEYEKLELEFKKSPQRAKGTKTPGGKAAKRKPGVTRNMIYELLKIKPWSKNGLIPEVGVGNGSTSRHVLTLVAQGLVVQYPNLPGEDALWVARDWKPAKEVSA